MLSTLLLAALTLGPVEPPPDTVFAVSRGDRLRVENLNGSIHVGSWNRDEIRIESRSRRDRAFRISHGQGVHRVRPARNAEDGSYRVMVPDWLMVDIRGSELGVTAEGLGNGIAVYTHEGDVTVRSVTGTVQVTSVDGRVVISDVEGDVDVETSDDDIRLTDVRGAVRAQSVDGDVTLERVRAGRVLAETVDGDVVFEGALERGGDYRLSTHDGDMTVWIPVETSVDLTIATFHGTLQSDFPITLQRFGGKDRQLRFQLGNGGATMLVEAFDGGIYLRQIGPDGSRRPSRRPGSSLIKNKGSLK